MGLPSFSAHTDNSMCHDGAKITPSTGMNIRFLVLLALRRSSDRQPGLQFRAPHHQANQVDGSTDEAFQIIGPENK
jgi:hypothetical protein